MGIVGRAESFRAVASLLGETGTDVVHWSDEDTDLSDFPFIESVALSGLEDVPLVFFCAPVEVARSLARKLGEVITGRHVLVHLSRDLEPGTMSTLSNVLRDETATHRFGFLTGPLRAEDVGSGRLSAAAVSSVFPEVHELLEQYLVSSRFRLYRNRDLVGSEIAAAFTRIVAFVIGIARQMNQGSCVEGILFSRGLAETAILVRRYGGQGRTPFGMAGAGNLYVDVAEPGSPEYLMGREMVRRGAFDVEEMTQEFGIAAQTLGRLALSFADTEGNVQLGIFDAVCRIVHGDLDAANAAQFLMELPVLDD
ncbi:MAG: hypothetical protein AAGI01_09725 [Myxococcota bacterium]